MSYTFHNLRKTGINKTHYNMPLSISSFVNMIIYKNVQPRLRILLKTKCIFIYKGPSIKYVRKVFKIFDPLPLCAIFLTSSIYSYISVRIGSDPPPPPCVRTLWMTPNRKAAGRNWTQINAAESCNESQLMSPLLQKC